MNKFYLTLLTLVFALSSCKKDEAQKFITPAANQNLSQTLQSNDTVAQSVTFTSSDVWVLAITEEGNPGVPTWITATPTKGEAGTYTLNMSLSKNTEAVRSATIRLICGESSFTVSVKQLAIIAEITPAPNQNLDQTLKAIDTIAQSVTFTATAPWALTITEAGNSGVPAWITAKPTSGAAGTYTLNMSLSKNTGAVRSATIRLICGESSFTVSVKQLAIIAEITPAPNQNLDQTLKAIDTIAQSVTFTATASWTLAITEAGNFGVPAWITAKPTSGAAGTYTLNMSLSENTGAERSAVIKLTCGESSFTISVKQQAQIKQEKLVKQLVFTDEDGTNTATLTYNDKNQPILFSSGTDEFKITYSGDSITHKRGNEISMIIVTENGRAKQILDYEDRSGSEPKKYNLTYNADGYFIESQSSYKTTLKWTNGNFTELLWSDPVIKETLEYGTDLNKGNLDFNWVFTGSFEGTYFAANGVPLWGLTGKRSKNFVTKMTAPNLVSLITYQFDKDGYPVKITNTWSRSSNPATNGVETLTISYY